jgi:hypothetical protein
MPIDPTRLGELVEERAERWASLHIAWEFRPATTVGPKPSASLRCESADAVGQLTVWTSGEADLDVGYFAAERMTNEHYDVTGDLGLRGCLDDLERLMSERP